MQMVQDMKVCLQEEAVGGLKFFMMFLKEMWWTAVMAAMVERHEGSGWKWLVVYMVVLRALKSLLEITQVVKYELMQYQQALIN
jgi:hypothetical protein